MTRHFAMPESDADVIGAMATILREQRVDLDDQFAVMAALTGARFSLAEIDRLMGRAIARCQTVKVERRNADFLNLLRKVTA